MSESGSSRCGFRSCLVVPGHWKRQALARGPLRRALGILQPGTERAVESSLHRLGLSRYRVALPRLRGAHEDAIGLFVERPDVNSDDALRGTAPNDAPRGIDFLDCRGDVKADSVASSAFGVIAPSATEFALLRTLRG